MDRFRELLKQLRYIQIALLVVLVFMVGFVAGTQTGIATAQSAIEDVRVFFQPLLEAFELIEEQYVDPYGREVDRAKLLDGAITGMINALDDEYSGYMDPAGYAISNSDLAGEFEGIGVVIRRNEEKGGIEVVGVMENTPAARAGVRVGDVFVEVDGVNVTDDNNLDLATKVRGPAGSRVSITFRRGEELITFEIARERIDIPNIESKVLEGTNVAYIRLNQFTSDARRLLDQALTDVRVNERDGLIFDLRGNYGGLLSSAIEIGSAFIEEGPIVIEDFGDARAETILRANGSFSNITVPIVLLVDETSASASELVAGALQDLGKATLIGEPTLGKGTVQVWRALSNGGGVRVTIARWLTPNRNWIHGAGITPDIIVTWTPEDAAEDPTDDPQLTTAIRYLQGVIAEAASQVE